MLANDNKSDSWKKTLRFITHCPVCKAEYKSEAAQFLGNQAEARFVHFNCSHCQSNFMAMVMMISKGISTVGMITDLTFQDMQKLYQLQPLTIDELIEARQFIHHTNFINALSGTL